MKHPKRKKFSRSAPRTRRLAHHVRRGLSWLWVSELAWPAMIAAVAFGIFIALPPSRLDAIPTGPAGKLGDALDSVAIALNLQQPTEQAAPSSEATPTTGNSKTSKKSNNTSGQGSSAGTSTASSVQFVTLPPGSPLPSDAECAARVRSMPEVRPANTTYNNTKGTGGNTEFSRVTGNYTGSTDEILQWASCKWGIDEDIARAQAVKESWWFHRTGGDYATDPALCWPPNNQLVNGQCPESVGILQVRYQYHNSGLAAGTYSPYYSTAYNADYTYAVWRDCYEGNMTWLNSVEKGATYAAGDVWGCVGEWFSGRWYTPTTLPYINAVKDYKSKRMWEHPDFLAAQ
ncbi:MAG: hypothetical protein KIH63_004380 [Candidatus Saccharibacteria bacterium]|nr:hypothetical protein [Candidatus Saccharibacteria bacterium]